jgi:hypothetical protein
MRRIILPLNFLLVLCFSNCGSKKTVYSLAEDQFVFDSDSIPYGQKKILVESSASFLTFEFSENSEPLKIHLRFHGIMPGINTIEKIHLELLQKNEKGEIIKVQAKELKEFKVEYSNGRSIISLPIKNEAISSQVNWKEADWGEYTKNNSVDFVGTYIFELEEYPQNLIMSFKMTWKDREKLFETTLTKGEYKGPKINPKF